MLPGILLSLFSLIAQTPEAESALQPPAASALLVPLSNGMAGAWRLEAGHVARKLEFDEAAESKLTEAFVKTRQRFEDNIREKLRSLYPTMSDDPTERRDTILAARQALETTLAADLRRDLTKSIGAERTSNALAMLLPFDRRWDVMVSAISGMDLGDKTGRAMTQIYEAVEKLREASANPDPDNPVYEKDVRKNLDSRMKAVLTPKQMDEWVKITARQFRNPSKTPPVKMPDSIAYGPGNKKGVSAPPGTNASSPSREPATSIIPDASDLEKAPHKEPAAGK